MEIWTPQIASSPSSLADSGVFYLTFVFPSAHGVVNTKTQIAAQTNNRFKLVGRSWLGVAGR